jgi:Fe2+ or Zn2+ uptake regulation protein
MGHGYSKLRSETRLYVTDSSARKHFGEWQAMKAKGRLTRHRKTILEALRAHYQHPTAADVFRIVRRRRPRIAYATIYNALNWLQRSGLIATVSFTNEATRYDPIIKRHDHLVCTHCGSLTDVDLKLPPKIVSRAARAKKFRIDRHRTELFGMCKRCTVSNAAMNVADIPRVLTK